jgi:probable DNA repair protein
MTGSLMDQALKALDAGGTVVTANRRLARFLTGAFNRAALAESGSQAVWPSPDILPWDAWSRREWSRLRDTGPAEALRTALSPAQAQRLWRTILDTSDGGLLDTGSAAREAGRARALLAGWRLDARSVLAQTEADSQGFLSLYEAFEKRLAARSWVDQPALETSLADCAGPPDRAVVFAGFEFMTPLQQAIVERVDGRVVTDAQGDSGRTMRLSFADMHEELEAAAAWLRGRLENAPGSRSALVVPDLAAVRDEVEYVLGSTLHPGPVWALPAPHRRPWNVTLGRPLSEWGMVHCALDALRGLSGSISFDKASRLLRARWLGPAAEERDGRAAVEMDLRANGYFEIRASQLAVLARRRGCQGFADGLEAALARLQGLPARQRLAEWARQTGDLLDDLRWPGDSSLDSESFQIRAAWNELLEALAALDSVTGLATYEEAVGELSTLARERVFQLQTGDAPIQVLGLLEAQGQCFDALWVCGLDDQTWPPGLKPNGFVPTGLQRELCMPRSCPDHELALARTRTSQLASAADEVVFSWPRSRGDEPLFPSPLLADMDPAEPGSLLHPAPDWRAGLLASAATEPMPEDRLPAISGHRRGGMAVLDNQSRCPFRAAAIHRLRAEPVETPSPGVDPASRGRWAHAALRCLWANWGSQASAANLEPAERGRQIRAAVQDARRESGVEDRPVDPGHLEIEAKRLTALIEELARADLHRPPFTVEATEVPVELELGGLAVSGRIDRIDRDALGDWIIDYKTADPSLKGWLEERLADPQVPAYAGTRETLAGMGFGVLRAGTTGYRGLVCGDESVGPFRSLAAQKRPPPPADNWPALRIWWQTRVEALAAEFASGRATVAPRSPEACRYCGLDALCRRHAADLPLRQSHD